MKYLPLVSLNPITFVKRIYQKHFFHLIWWDNLPQLSFLFMNEWILSLQCFHFCGAESKCLHEQSHVCSGLVGGDPVYQLPVKGGWNLSHKRLHWGHWWKPYREECLQDNTELDWSFTQVYSQHKVHPLIRGDMFIVRLYSLWNLQCGLWPDTSEQSVHLKVEFFLQDD